MNSKQTNERYRNVVGTVIGTVLRRVIGTCIGTCIGTSLRRCLGRLSERLSFAAQLLHALKGAYPQPVNAWIVAAVGSPQFPTAADPVGENERRMFCELALRREGGGPPTVYPSIHRPPTTFSFQTALTRLFFLFFSPRFNASYHHQYSVTVKTTECLLNASFALPERATLEVE